MKIKKQEVIIANRRMRVPIKNHDLPLTHSKYDIVKANGVEKQIMSLEYSSGDGLPFGNYYWTENVKNGVWGNLYECEIDK